MTEQKNVNPDSECVWNEPTAVQEGAHLSPDKDFDQLALHRPFEIGDRFRLNLASTEQYPEEYKNGRVFVVSGVFDHYVSAKDMAKDPSGHPGFDRAAQSCLYEADGLPFALYDHEMEQG